MSSAAEIQAPVAVSRGEYVFCERQALNVSGWEVEPVALECWSKRKRLQIYYDQQVGLEWYWGRIGSDTTIYLISDYLDSSGTGTITLHRNVSRDPPAEIEAKQETNLVFTSSE